MVLLCIVLDDLEMVPSWGEKEQLVIVCTLVQLKAGKVRTQLVQIGVQQDPLLPIFHRPGNASQSLHQFALHRYPSAACLFRLP